MFSVAFHFFLSDKINHPNILYFPSLSCCQWKTMMAWLPSVIPVLQSILVDYPGGQLLEEALQNAEDRCH
jgi:hypothetical protein